MNMMVYIKSLASSVSEDLQQPWKVPPGRLIVALQSIWLQRMFKRRSDGSFDYDAFIRSQSLILIGGRWIIHWRKKENQKVSKW